MTIEENGVTNVSDLISRSDILSWESGDVVTISAGTGSGKSYFIKNALYNYAKENNLKILMLLHRLNCVEQFQMELDREEKNDHLTIKTYQSLEYKARKREMLDLEEYDYIISDEFHYFLDDAKYNGYTDMSLNGILKANHAVRIFMSATGDKMRHYLKEERHMNINTIDYTLENDYKNISKLNFFYNKSTLELLLDRAVVSGDKAIFFIQSATVAYDLHKKYPLQTIFNCSKSNSEYYRFVDEEKINKLLKNEKFNDQILITTSVFDAGINIVDRELNDIVIDMDDIGSVIQCIGRKRFIDDDDFLNVNIRAMSRQRLGGRVTGLSNVLEMPYELYNNGDKSMIDKYYRENINSDMLYAVRNECGEIEFKLNEMMFFKVVSDVNETTHILSIRGKSYCKYLTALLGKYTFNDIEEEVKKMNVKEYLESLTGIRLFKEEQVELANKINLRVDGRQYKSISKLNQAIDMMGIKYVLLAKRINSERYWEVHKVDVK